MFLADKKVGETLKGIALIYGVFSEIGAIVIATEFYDFILDNLWFIGFTYFIWWKICIW